MDRNCETLQNYLQFDGIAFKIERHPLKFDRTVQIFDKNRSNHRFQTDSIVFKPSLVTLSKTRLGGRYDNLVSMSTLRLTPCDYPTDLRHDDETNCYQR